MDDLFYSTPALNILHKFHDNKIIVFVEGRDDKIFWGKYFEHSGVHNCHFKATGGFESLKIKIDQIVNNNAEILVACDTDHRGFCPDEKIVHPRLITTYGYAIENSMYCSETINNIISKISRSYNYDKKEEITNYFSQICRDSFDLLTYDIASYKYKKGIKVFGDTPNRFLSNNKSTNINTNLVIEFINSIKDNFSEGEVTEVQEQIHTEKRDIWFLIKGHFLTNLVINIVKKLSYNETGKNCTLNSDNFYTLAIDGCAICNFQCENCQTVISNVKSAVATLQ